MIANLGFETYPLHIMEAKKSAVLIVAYRRSENTKRIIDLCIKNGVPRLYVVVDFPADNRPETTFDVNQTKEKIINASKSSSVPILYQFRESNAGCAASVLSGCDWFFDNESFGIVLEDDCIPSDSFFNMVGHYKEQLESNGDIWMICGTQFAPELSSRDEATLSKYALIWGWATSSKKWKEIAQSLRQSENKARFVNLLSPESIYWNAGSRRSLNGFVDVWDTAVVNEMHQRRKFAILPKKSLVENIGSDEVATHTRSGSPWLNRDTGSFDGNGANAKYSSQIDQWLKENFYKISIRHILSTRITFILDIYRRLRLRPNSLFERWDKALRELKNLQS